MDPGVRGIVTCLALVVPVTHVIGTPGAAFAGAAPGAVGPLVIMFIAHVTQPAPAKLAVAVQVALATLSVVATLMTPLAVLASSLAVVELLAAALAVVVAVAVAMVSYEAFAATLSQTIAKPATKLPAGVS